MPISASSLVSSTPGVLSGGGDAIDISAVLLTYNTRTPIGTAPSFASAADVGAYYGLSSVEYEAALIYFAGVNNATVLPGELLFCQYPIAAVAAYTRGGNLSALTLAQLQALSGSFSVTINGTASTASNISLSAATSFSNAAEIIGAALGIEGASVGTVTGSIGGTITGTTSSTTLTVGTVLTGSLQTGDTVSGTDGTNSLPAGTKIVKQLTGTPGGVGTYQISAAATPSNLGSTTVTSLSTTLNITALGTATAVAVADVISGTSITANTYIVSQLSGTTNGVGLYQVSAAMTVASEVITVFKPGVTFDSTQSAFVVTSGTTGPASTIGFASGTLAASLYMEQANGAVTSQGASAATPAAAMSQIKQLTTNWVSFTHLFDPDAGSGNTQKLLFAAWNSEQNNRFWYVPWDSDVTATTTNPATSSLGYLLTQEGYGGCTPIWTPNFHNAVGALAWAASIDFDATNGRSTLAYKTQPGLTADVTTDTAAANLKANGYTFYGDYSLNGQEFICYQPGTVSGEFDWADSYINQIWMTAQMSSALLTLMINAKALPFNSRGYGLVSGALNDPITAAGNFGAWVSGVTLSAAQIQEVNGQAGLNIGNTLQSVGYYLQVTPASSAVRSARGPLQVTFWYCDGQSIQSIDLGTVELQ